MALFESVYILVKRRGFTEPGLLSMMPWEFEIMSSLSIADKK